MGMLSIGSWLDHPALCRLVPPARLLALALTTAVCTTAMPLSSLEAQGLDCARLQQQIASFAPANPAQAQQYAAAAARQRSELDRTTAYARSIGCDRKKFLIFGESPPAQCGALQDQIGRMQENYASLNAQAQQYSGDAQRRALQTRYDANCREGASSPQQTRGGGFFDNLFGGSNRQDTSGLRDVPIGPDGQPADPLVDLEGPRGGSKAVCVRTCDGGFFPVSYGANKSALGSLEDLCHALCPAAETMLFTYSPNRDIDTAISSNGTPYSSLPNAGRFRTKFDPACTCKPQDKSWAEALGGAERLLGSSGRDMIVTPEKAEELSRAQPANGRKPAKPAPGTKPAPGGKPLPTATLPTASAQPATPAASPVPAVADGNGASAPSQRPAGPRQVGPQL